MILYHGTNVQISEIDLAHSKPFKDFGRAFYLSDIRTQAEEVAYSRTSFFGGDPLIFEYEFDESVLRNGVLRVKRFEEYNREWADFIFMNRNAATLDAMMIMILYMVLLPMTVWVYRYGVFKTRQ